MSIPGLNTVMPKTGDGSASNSAVLGKEDFLNLLVAQMEHQDPLEPMENTEFTAQLAQFSSLEQLTNVNQNLEYALLYQSSINNSQAVSFIGKTVKAEGASIEVSEGAPTDIHFELFAGSAETLVNIYGPGGTLVRVLELGSLGTGEQAVIWDGCNSQGKTVEDGTYTFEVVAVDEEGAPMETSSFISASISGITFAEGTTYLLAGGRKIPIASVLEVTDGE